jgi:hypothetical protein
VVKPSEFVVKPSEFVVLYASVAVFLCRNLFFDT